MAHIHLTPFDDALIDWDATLATARAFTTEQGHSVTKADSIDDAPANPITVAAKSMERDAYLRAIYVTMKEAAKRQLSGTRPALLCIYIPEIRDFSSLVDESGLKAMTEYFFGKPENAHVFAVAYTSDTQSIKEQNGYQFSADMLVFKNALCKFPAARTFNVLNP